MKHIFTFGAGVKILPEGILVLASKRTLSRGFRACIHAHIAFFGLRRPYSLFRATDAGALVYAPVYTTSSRQNAQYATTFTECAVAINSGSQ